MSTSAVITTPKSIMRVQWDGYPSAIMEWLEAQGDPRARVDELVKEGGWDWRYLTVDDEESYNDDEPLGTEEEVARLHQNPQAVYSQLAAEYHYDLSGENSRLTVYRLGEELSAQELELARAGIN